MNMQLLKLFQGVEFDWERRRVERRVLERRFANFTGKIFSLPDLHEPFTDHELLVKHVIPAIEAEKQSLIILDGDTLSLDIYSRFQDSIEGAPPTKIELGNLNLLLKVLCKCRGIKHIIMTTSNHEFRLESFLIRLAGQRIAKDLQDIGVQLRNLITANSKKFSFIRDWFIQIGDTVFCHPHNSSALKGRTVTWAMDYFDLRLKNPFHALFTGHNHWQAKVLHRKRIGIECGCLMRAHDYMRNSKVSRGKYDVSMKGYGECIMNRGKIEFNSADFVHLGWEEPL